MVPKIRGTFLGVPIINKDDNILGSILGSRILGNYHFKVRVCTTSAHARGEAPTEKGLQTTKPSDLEASTWTLQCSSFLGLVWFLVRTPIRTTQELLQWRV